MRKLFFSFAMLTILASTSFGQIKPGVESATIPSDLLAMSNYIGEVSPGDNANQDLQQTSLVDSYTAENWVLYDMQDNTWEWCSDGSGYYSKSGQNNMESTSVFALLFSGNSQGPLYENCTKQVLMINTAGCQIIIALHAMTFGLLF